MKKFSLIIFIFLLSCGYKPIYSSKNINFSIGEIQKENTPLNNEFSRNLKTFSNNDIANQLKIKIESKKKITVKSKDTKGNPNLYELKIILNITVYDEINGKTHNKKFSQNINYKNRDDKFQLSQYQKEVEELLINKIIENVLSYLSNI
jgi:hypothetical protein